MAKTDLLIAWLNDAYGMEQAQIEMLGRFIDDFGALPDIQARLEDHLEETRRQAEDIKGCIESLGQEVSGGKSLLGSMIGAVQGMSTAPYKDEMVKDMLILHAGEHFEHASYLALAEAARICKADEIADVCERIAEEEKATADWTEEQIAMVVQATITQNEPDEE